MMDFSKYPTDELTQLNSLVIKNMERSEANKLYFFSQNPIDKAKVFAHAYRILNSACKFISSDVAIKADLINLLTALQPIYFEILRLLESHNTMAFGRSDAHDRIFSLVSRDSQIEDLIDAFALLCERTEIVQISKVKGYVMEGKSKDAYKKMFSEAPKDFQDPVI